MKEAKMKKIWLDGDKYKAEFDICNPTGRTLGKYQIYSTGNWSGSSKLSLNICAIDDEPFESDSLSCIELDIFNLIKGAVEWQRGNYHEEKKDLATYNVIASLKYMIAMLELEAQDIKEERLNK